jgi:hypothetical protein
MTKYLKNNLKGQFIMALGFSPHSAGSIALGPRQARYYGSGSVWQRRLLTSWWPGSRGSKRKKLLTAPSKGYALQRHTLCDPLPLLGSTS